MADRLASADLNLQADAKLTREETGVVSSDDKRTQTAVMILAMILAHLVGDFILQTDRIAYWKSQELKGVLVHGSIILAVTAAFALPFRPFWWQGVLFISITHTLIDASQWYLKPKIAPVLRFFIDQTLHFLAIFIALAAGGYLALPSMAVSPIADLETIMLYALGYAFVTMPAWVLLKFIGYWLVAGSGPIFPDTFNKYAGILERVLIVSFMLAGLYVLVPILAVPRVYFERKQLAGNERRPVYLFETLGGIALAVGVGILLLAV